MSPILFYRVQSCKQCTANVLLLLRKGGFNLSQAISIFQFPVGAKEEKIEVKGGSPRVVDINQKPPPGSYRFRNAKHLKRELFDSIF